MKVELDRRRAVLLGLALGDAFGAPVAGWPPADISAFFGRYAALPKEWPAEARGLPVERRKRMGPLGLHGAVTQQALSLINVTQSDPGWCGRGFADWLIEGFARDAWRGCDLHFMAAVHGLRKGRDHRGAGTRFAGGTPAARVAPLGALYADQENRLCDVVYESTLITHGDIRAAAGAHAVAIVTADLLAGLSPPEIRKHLADRVRAGEARWRPKATWAFCRAGAGRIPDAIETLFCAPLGSDEMVRSAVKAVAESTWESGDGALQANTDHVLLAPLHAMGMALRDQVSPDECLAAVVRNGAAASTAGAICGALLGARFGSGWMTPSRLSDQERLGQYAEAVSTGDGGLESRAQFMEAEAEWTRRLGVFGEEMVAERRTGRPRPEPVPS